MDMDKCGDCSGEGMGGGGRGYGGIKDSEKYNTMINKYHRWDNKFPQMSDPYMCYFSQ